MIEENISNFDKAFDFFAIDMSHDDLYEFLKNGDLIQKQLACVKISSINNQAEAKILMENLTGIDGKVREAVSFKLRQFLSNSAELFRNEEFYKIFLDSIIDINGNICRNILDALVHLVQYPDFCEYFIREILSRMVEVLTTIESFNYKDKKYVTNKEVFKLYWYLETLAIFPSVPAEKLLPLLIRASEIQEYTIREKIAQLFKFLPKNEQTQLEKILSDKNFYVKNALKTN